MRCPVLAWEGCYPTDASPVRFPVLTWLPAYTSPTCLRIDFGACASALRSPDLTSRLAGRDLVLCHAGAQDSGDRGYAPAPV
eukprot:531209-Rhodomonas_salina.2